MIDYKTRRPQKVYDLTFLLWVTFDVFLIQQNQNLLPVVLLFGAEKCLKEFRFTCLVCFVFSLPIRTIENAPKIIFFYFWCVFHTWISTPSYTYLHRKVIPRPNIYNPVMPNRFGFNSFYWLEFQANIEILWYPSVYLSIV